MLVVQNLGELKVLTCTAATAASGCPSLYSLGAASTRPSRRSTSSPVEDVPSIATACTRCRTSPPSASKLENSALCSGRALGQGPPLWLFTMSEACCAEYISAVRPSGET